MVSTKRVVTYLPEKVVEGLREACKECTSDGEAVAKILLEVLAGWVERRSFPDYIFEEAKKYLLEKYEKEYALYLAGLEK